jgi:hypothetical protein
LRDAIEQISHEEGTTVDQFVLSAIAEKLSAMKTSEIFARRRARADRAAFRRILDRDGGEPPGPGDEVPPDLA